LAQVTRTEIDKNAKYISVPLIDGTSRLPLVDEEKLAI
jgi:hypothetical protein